MVMRRFFASTIRDEQPVSEYSVIYSLRNVSGWTGDVIQVRRLSDSMDEWFGYSGGVGTEIDTSEIATFLGASAGRVRRLKNTGNAGSVYDLPLNSGGGPEIFDGTDFYFFNGKLALNWDVGNVDLVSDVYPSNDSTITDRNSFWSTVFQSQSTDENFGVVLYEGGQGNDTNRNVIVSDTRDSIRRGALYIASGTLHGADLNTALSTTENTVLTAWKQGGTISCYKNGTLQTDTGDSSATFPVKNLLIRLGVQLAGGGFYFKGLFCEAVLDLTEDSAKRDNLMNDQKSFYGIS